jgi:hypothetical protein
MMGEMREAGARRILVYCADHKCSHHIALDPDGWSDSVRLSDLEPQFVCSACGKRGAEVRPDALNLVPISAAARTMPGPAAG